MRKLSLVAGLMLAFNASVYANEPMEIQEDEQGSWSWSISVNTNRFDESVKSEGIEESATGFSIDLDYIKNQWITTLSASYLSYDDNASFKQEVVGTGWANKGDRSTKSSDASGLLIGVASGMAQYYGENQDIAVYGQGGIDIMTRSERTIPGCSNCSEQDIDLDGGVFVKGGIKKVSQGFNMGLYVKYYLTGDGLNSSVGLSFGSSF
ncbi:hypothetical protein [Thalassotalea ganghwensis]